MFEQKSQNNIIYPKVLILDVIKAFWQGIKPKKWWFFSMIIFVVLANVTGIITPIFYKKFFDIIAIGGDKSFVGSRLLVVIIYILFLNLILWIFYRLATIANIKYQMDTMANLKQNSYNYLIEHSYSFFTNNFVGSLVQKVNRFTRSFERLSDDLVWNLLPLVVK